MPGVALPAGAQRQQPCRWSVVTVDPADSWVVFVGAGAESVASEVVGVTVGAADATTSRDALEEGLAMGRCGVACLRHLDGEDLTWLVSLRLRAPLAPLVVVAPLCPAAIAALRALPAGAPPVVWAEEVAARLATAVRHEAERDPLQRLVAVVGASVQVTPVVGHAMRVAARSWPPITRVVLLAEAMTVSRGTLYNHWEDAFGGRLTPKEALDWVVLVRALMSERQSSIRMAAEVGVDVRTLERLSGRLLGKTLAAARRRGPDAVFRALGDRLSDLMA